MGCEQAEGVHNGRQDDGIGNCPPVTGDAKDWPWLGNANSWAMDEGDAGGKTGWNHLNIVLIGLHDGPRVGGLVGPDGAEPGRRRHEQAGSPSWSSQALYSAPIACWISCSKALLYQPMNQSLATLRAVTLRRTAARPSRACGMSRAGGSGGQRQQHRIGPAGDAMVVYRRAKGGSTWRTTRRQRPSARDSAKWRRGAASCAAHARRWCSSATSEAQPRRPADSSRCPTCKHAAWGTTVSGQHWQASVAARPLCTQTMRRGRP